jgi:hypothetical protein
VISKFKNSISLSLLLVFIFPSIVQFEHHLEHHHEHFICKAKNEQHLHEYHENCFVCNFEFSVFSSDHKNIVIRNDQPEDKYFNNYRLVHYSNRSKYSFSLRAPPVKFI